MMGHKSRNWMRKYAMLGLVVSCLVSWVAVWGCIEQGEEFLLAARVCAGAAALLSGVLLLICGIRLVLGLYRWHPAVRDVLLCLFSVLLLIWGYRGFERVTWYELHLADCSGVRTSPTWHVSPLQKAYMAASDDWSVGRFGLSLVANMTEFHNNYHPIVGHGPCRVEYSVCEHGHVCPVMDAFSLELPLHAESVLRLQMAEDSTALGLIVVSHPGQVESWLESNQPPQQWAAAQGHSWFPLTPGKPLDLPGFQGQVHFYIAYRPGPATNAPANHTPYDLVHFAVREVER